jgi:autotransporter-associated beta strand protein
LNGRFPVWFPPKKNAKKVLQILESGIITESNSTVQTVPIPMKFSSVFSAGLACAALTSTSMLAQTTFDPTTGGTYTWATNANWSPATFPNSPGAVVNLNNNISGNVILTLPAAGITLGELNIGDSDGTNTFAVNANTLTLQGASPGDSATINISATGNLTNTIGAAVVVAPNTPVTIANLGNQTLSLNGGFNLGANTLTLNITNTSTTPVSSIGANFSGTGELIKNGQGRFNINGNGTYNGNVTVNTGLLQIVGSSGRLESTNITVRGNAISGVGDGGSALVVGANVAAPVGGRLNSNLALTLSGGGLRYEGSNAAGITSESISSITVGPGTSNITLNSGGNRTTDFTAGSLTRQGRGVLQVRGSSLGGPLSGNNTSHLFVTSAPSLIGGGGSAGSPTISVLPWAIAGTNTSNEANELATYDSTGLRPLAASEYTTLALATANDNVSTGTMSLSANKTINSLKLTATSVQNIGSHTLGIGSGAILFTGNNGGIGTGTVNFGSAEGVVWSTGTNSNSISASITGSNGLTKAGTGTLTLSAAAGNNTYTGQTTVSGGVLRIGATNTLPTGTALVLANTTNNILSGSFTAVTTALDLNGFNQTIGSLAGGGSFGGNVLLGSGTLTTGGDNSSTTYAGAISGTGALVKEGSGTFTLTGSSTYSGGTTVSAGTLLISNEAGSATGSGPVQVASGARIGGNGTIAGNLTLNSGAQFVFSLTDTLTVNGTVSLHSSFGVASLFGLDSTVPLGVYTLIDGTPTDFSALGIQNFGAANAASIGGGKFAFFQNGSLELVVIPEPSSAVLLLLGGAVLMAYRRRKS